MDLLTRLADDGRRQRLALAGQQRRVELYVALARATRRAKRARRRMCRPARQARRLRTQLEP